MGILQASSRLAAHGAYALALIAASFGWAPVALAKKTPNAVIEVTPAGGSTYGDKLTMYGIVSAPTAADPVPTGTITFATREPPFNINTPLCSVTIDVDYAVQSCNYSSLIPAGTHHFILIYSGDDNYQGNDDGMLASEDYAISKQTPTFSLAPPAPVFVGQYAALKFSFDNATNTEGKFTASVSGQAYCSIYSESEICAAGKMSRAGIFGVSIMFDGDANHNAVPSTEVVGQVTVLEAPTTLKIAPRSAITLGETADMVLTLSDIVDPEQALSGDITLSDGEVSCRIEITGETSVHCPFKPLSQGIRQLIATYSGFSGYWSPATATGTLEVVAARVDGACGSDNGGVLAATPTNLCAAGTPSVVSGTGHPWSWTCAGSGGGSDASCSATAETTTKPVPVLAWPAPAPIVYGTALGAAQLNATASWNGNPVAGTFSYTPGAGTLLSVGPNQILSATFVPSDTASYATPASPVTTTITVNAAPLTPVTMTLTASPTTITPGQSVLLTATVSGSAANPTAVETIARRTSSPASALAAAVAPTGSVTFQDGGTLIGSVNLGGNGIAALNVSTFAAGTHHVIATYAGDDTFAPATATATVVVTAAALQAPAAAPALDRAALCLLALLLAGLGAATRRNKRRLRVR